MSSSTLRPWTEVVRLHPDVEAGALTEALFAIDLGAIAEGSTTVPVVNRDPQEFFRATYLTADLSKLLNEVLASLAGKENYNRVLKLRTPFGGGKSHTLAALYHASKSRAVLDHFPELKGFANPGSVAVAVFDGEKFDALSGKDVGGGRTVKTMWGWLAWQIDPKKAYPIVEEHDQKRVSPGGDTIRKLFTEGAGGRPVLILIDELLQYVERAGSVSVLDSTLQRQAKDFFHNLTVEVANSRNWALVYSLQWSKSKEALAHLALLEELDHIAARVDQMREPVQGDEVLPVVQRRLLGEFPPADRTQDVAEVYSGLVSGMQRSFAESESGRRQAEEEGLLLRDRIQKAYPFHPALIDAMRDRWASIDAYQRTRGALRFLGKVLHALKKEGTSTALVGPGDIPIRTPEVRLQMLKELGAQNDYDPVISEDITGPNARAKRIDERLARETPALANVRPATRLATAILVYSFGGLKKEGKGEMELLPPGISERELLAACVSPDLDNITAMAVLAELRNMCVYLHYDGVRYCFKKDPNVIKLIEEEEKHVTAKDVMGRVRDLLGKKLAGSPNTFVWPDNSSDLPDGEPQFILGYLPLDFAVLPSKEQDTKAWEMLYQYGNRPRRYRNGIGVVVPDKKAAEAVKRAVGTMIAIERVEGKKRQLRLSDSQLDELKERRRTEEAASDSAFKDLYTAVWLPRMEEDADGQRKEGIERVDKATRTLQATEINKRVMELLTVAGVQRLYPTVTPRKLTERVKLGESTAEGESLRLGVRVSDIVDAFYSFLEPPRLESAGAIRKAIVKGVQEGMFGYTSGLVPALGADGKFAVNPDKVVMGRSIDEDEVDFDSGFLMVPSAIPLPEPKPPIVGTPPVEPPVAPVPTVGAIPPQPPDKPRLDRHPYVRIRFRADREQVFKVFKAVANLADKSDEGKVTVCVEGKSSAGYDSSWLRNAVEEPLDEADVERMPEG
ncbi:MAG: DUF499 domain-containing protein [bacterium]